MAYKERIVFFLLVETLNLDGISILEMNTAKPNAGKQLWLIKPVNLLNRSNDSCSL